MKAALAVVGKPRLARPLPPCVWRPACRGALLTSNSGYNLMLGVLGKEEF